MTRCVLLVLAALALAPDAGAASSHVPSADPPASKEQVQIVRPEPGPVVGTVSIPDAKLGVLVQPEGRDWRSFRMVTLQWLAGGLSLAALVALATFYLVRGRIEIPGGASGLRVLRFNGLDRFGHWLTAISFIALALTGLVVTFGRTLLIPLTGHAAFATVAAWSKLIHNVSGAPFVLGLALITALWVRDNLPERGDLAWLRTGGGLMSRHARHPACGRFNAGQKIVFWSVLLGGLGLAATGFMLLNPFVWADIDGMQIIHMAHGILAGLLVAVILGHIYIGSLGMEGAFDAMGSGEVDENWARDHHALWYERQVRRGYADTSRRRAAE